MAQKSGVIGTFRGVETYWTTRQAIEEGRWSTMYYYVISDDGDLMFHQGQVLGYLKNGNLKMFDQPKKYPRGTAEEEMMQRVIISEDELLKKACDTSWTESILKNSN